MALHGDMERSGTAKGTTFHLPPLARQNLNARCDVEKGNSLSKEVCHVQFE